ncbi:MAG: 3-hydroxyacyl-ACP dehydratase FabZ [Eubacteriales bacterium]|nr:3-hydroxyacyl-ACP dehydratase FabZ [Eubacteriales bacterium]
MRNLSKEEVKKILPHREPFLMVDEVADMNDRWIRASLFLSPELDFFGGHFPGNPVMPGVLLIEAMAQTADILLLSKEEYREKTPYFMGVDRVSFRRKAVPGDRIYIEAGIKEIFESKDVVSCDTTIFIDGRVCATGVVTLAMR